MNESLQILRSIQTLSGDDPAILATVVDLQGSGYRRPGARMLIMPDGQTAGTISGGCLEADVLERARRVRQSGVSEIYTYDTTKDENSVFSLNMGCRGVIRILMERITRASELFAALQSSIVDRQTFILATEINGTDVGRRIITPLDGAVPDALSGVFENFVGSALPYDTADPTGVEWTLERLGPPVALIIFGAGADAVPLAGIAAELGWQVSVVDHRPAFLTEDRFPEATLVHVAADSVLDPSFADTRTAAVIMTHNYSRDRLVLPMTLRSRAFYIGALGPKHRTTQLVDELTRDGHAFSPVELSRLYAPIGLDLGAATPETIALAITSEIQAILGGRTGGHLRDRSGPIYDR